MMEWTYEGIAKWRKEREADLIRELREVLDAVQNQLSSCDAFQCSDLRDQFRVKKDVLHSHLEDLETISTEGTLRFRCPTESVPYHLAKWPKKIFRSDWCADKELDALPVLPVFSVHGGNASVDVIVIGENSMEGDQETRVDALPPEQQPDVDMIEADARDEDSHPKVEQWLETQNFNGSSPNNSFAFDPEQNGFAGNKEDANDQQGPSMSKNSEDELVFSGKLAQKKHRLDQRLKPPGEFCLPKKKPPKDISDWALATTFPTAECPFNEKEMILSKISSVVSPLEMSLVPFDFMNSVREIEYKLQVFGEHLEQSGCIPVDMLSEGLPCVAREKNRGKWQRGRIEAVGALDCMIEFVDMGSTQLVDKKKIFFLPDSLSVVQPTAFVCCINRVDSRLLSKDRNERFLAEFRIGQEVLVTGVCYKGKREGYKGRIRVEIFDPKTHRNLAAEYQEAKKPSIDPVDCTMRTSPDSDKSITGKDEERTRMPKTWGWNSAPSDTTVGGGTFRQGPCQIQSPFYCSDVTRVQDRTLTPTTG